MAKLVVITKGLAAASHELGANWVTIGRGHDNMFQIVEPSVSGKHCEVRLQGAELAVRDLLSTNGTFVGGKKITEATLKAGETLRVGEVELRFEDSAEAPGTSFTSKMLVTNAGATQKKNAEPSKPAAVPFLNKANVDAAAKKRQVLFVDDSMAFLETFSELCSVFANHTWEIHSAATADRALVILAENAIDLVVLDIGIPMVDGIQLLGIIGRRYPGIKIAVLTGNASENKRAECLASGAELFMEKPVSAEGIKVVFNMLNDLVSWTEREGFSGALRQVGLPEVIQMECNTRHSSILEIRNQQVRGQIYIEVGAVIHAVAGDLTGEPAFYRLLSLKGGEFQLKPFQPPPQRTVADRWESLLMEAARACDEETAFVTKPSASDPDPAKKAAPETPPAIEMDHALGDEIVVVATYDGKWNPADGEKK